MGSGNKSSPRATPRGGYTAKGELKLPDGSKIEFDGDLKYYGNDKTVKGVVRQRVEAWETKRGKSKVEYAYSVDANGNEIMAEKRGGKNRVMVPIFAHDTEGSTFTHIHPRAGGMLGGTFSQMDLENFAVYKNKTTRAKAKEGTYSITKGKNFDKVGFLNMVSEANRIFDKEQNTAKKSILSKLNNREISYDDALKQSAKAFNTSLVKLHNAYKSGEKKYGYYYTLEQPK